VDIHPAVERAGLEGSDESEVSSDEENSSDSFEEGGCGGQISPRSTRRIKDLTKGPRVP
jgi:hypothetical protein